MQQLLIVFPLVLANFRHKLMAQLVKSQYGDFAGNALNRRLSPCHHTFAASLVLFSNTNIPEQLTEHI
jgi:hypothetical protein